MKCKSLLSSILVLTLVFSLCALPAAAITPENSVYEVTYFEDGSYLTTEVVTYASTRAASTRSGHKTATYSNASGVTLWTFTVYGTFTYNGTTSSATKASYGFNISDSNWSLKSANAYCSGNQAIAEGTFSGGIFTTRNTSVGLSCSPSGVLS